MFGACDASRPSPRRWHGRRGRSELGYPALTELHEAFRAYSAVILMRVTLPRGGRNPIGTIAVACQVGYVQVADVSGVTSLAQGVCGRRQIPS
jgi:hypothetical protein